MNLHPDTASKKKFMQTALFGIPEYEMKCESTYKPSISPGHLSKLRLLKQQTKKPITRLVAEALDLYFAR